MFEIGHLQPEFMIAAGHVAPSLQEIEETKAKAEALGASEREVLTCLCLLSHAPEAAGALALPVVFPAQHNASDGIVMTVERVMRWLPVDKALRLTFGDGPYLRHLKHEFELKLAPIRARVSAAEAATLSREREVREQAERERVSRWRTLSPAARADRRLDRDYSAIEFAAALDAETSAETMPPSMWGR